jgi:hypothetical protein
MEGLMAVDVPTVEQVSPLVFSVTPKGAAPDPA